MRGDISNEWKDFYYTKYFLKSPVPSEKFNKAWNTLREIGENFPQRLKVLNKFKLLSPLPGKIFSPNNDQKKQTLIKHFSKYFPEYISYYKKICLKTSSLNCSRLIKNKKLQDEVHLHHSASKK